MDAREQREDRVQTAAMVARFAKHGIVCGIDELGVRGSGYSVIPIYDTGNILNAYLIGENGVDVLFVKDTNKVFIPESDNLTLEHVDELCLAVKGEVIENALLVTRGDKVVGMFILVERG